MAMVVLILKIFVIFTAFVMGIYLLRHFIFALNRTIGEQRLYYQDIMDNELPSVSVLVPMHNEEQVAKNILDSLVSTVYPVEKLEIIPVLRVTEPTDRLEIIPIDDHSTDRTKDILGEYAIKYSNVKPIYRQSGRPGKPSCYGDS